MNLKLAAGGMTCKPLIFVLILSCARCLCGAQVPDSIPGRLADSALPEAYSPAPQHFAGRINLADSIVRHAYSFMGDRYRRGGTGATGFDCSGFTMTVFRRFGIRLPHTSAGQGLVGVDVLLKNVRKGDLILFRGRSRRSRRIGHVGIVISEKGDPVRFIHSSTGEGVRIDRIESDYYRKRFVKAVRVPALYQQH
jgi:cell wall-associated NlpC family hydrolase